MPGFAENVSDPFNLRWNGIDVQTTSSIQLEIQRSPLHPASLEIMRQKLDTVLAQASLIQRWSPTARIEQSKDFYPLVRLDESELSTYQSVVERGKGRPLIIRKNNCVRVIRGELSKLNRGFLEFLNHPSRGV